MAALLPANDAEATGAADKIKIEISKKRRVPPKIRREPAAFLTYCGSVMLYTSVPLVTMAYPPDVMPISEVTLRPSGSDAAYATNR